MKPLFKFCLLAVLLSWLPAAHAQVAPPTVSRIEIRHVGPAASSDSLIRANIRVKPGDSYLPASVDDDVKNLYRTGLFYNIRIVEGRAEDAGLVLTYVLQGKPRLTDIKITGNKKMRLSKIEKKITSKAGEPLDEQKLFTDSQAVQEMYQKAGFYRTQVKYVVNIDENAGRGAATFEIAETPKTKIVSVDFPGAAVFTEKKLRKVIKTKRHGFFSWLTQRGIFKEDQFQEDREKLAEFYRTKGYLDFEIKEEQVEKPTPDTMTIRLNLFEGRQYKVGAVTFKDAPMFPTNAISQTFKLKPGAVFNPSNLSRDVGLVEDFYGAKGHIDVTSGANLRVSRVPNTDTGTMDLEYKIDEGQKSYVEKIEIKGNARTRDRVIRRELALSPGDTFDMVRVKISKERLDGLQYFEKVDARPEPTDVPDRKNLVIAVEEKNTGQFSVGAGFSSVDSIVGFVEASQGNFDLFNPPSFTGGGQKMRVRFQLGTRRQDAQVSFVEPWFLGRKLALGVDAYHRSLSFQSIDNLYDETRTGGRVSLTKALGSDFLIGSVAYTIENAGINLGSAFHGDRTIVEIGPDGRPIIRPDPRNVPYDILIEDGHALISKFTASLAYDTRNSTTLPNHGQRTEFIADLAGGPLGGDRSFYKLELKSAWYFKGIFKGDVIEMTGHAGVVEGFDGGHAPFYERFYLGGLSTLRGYQYRGIGPRETGFTEPIGGNTYWYGSAEYSIPIFQQEKGPGVRVAFFYDIGSVQAKSYDFSSGQFSHDYGVGLRLNLPIGPLRLDYGIPINHDQYNSGSGRFQFGVGYTRDF